MLTFLTFHSINTIANTHRIQEYILCSYIATLFFKNLQYIKMQGRDSPFSPPILSTHKGSLNSISQKQQQNHFLPSDKISWNLYLSYTTLVLKETPAIHRSQGLNISKQTQINVKLVHRSHDALINNCDNYLQRQENLAGCFKNGKPVQYCHFITRASFTKHAYDQIWSTWVSAGYSSFLPQYKDMQN